MRKARTKIMVFLLVIFGFSVCLGQGSLKEFPYKTEGLSEKEAAIHLLSRFTYGYHTDDVEELLKEGFVEWFFRQLNGGIDDGQLEELLEPYSDVMLSNRILAERYPRNFQVRRMMVEEGYIEQDSINGRNRSYRQAYSRYLRERGYGRLGTLYREFIATKVMRAAFSSNQLQEVMTDFWFNHFNVSFTKAQAGVFIPSYENHVIRPNSLGTFGGLLLGTAKAPAMLLYLDNAASVAERENSRQGINENYARELMELHTLGVDGGYSQKDVSEVARILTGWTLYPMSNYGNQNLVGQIERMDDKGRNRIEEDFVFADLRHDKGRKVVMGKSFNQGGYEEGVELLGFLASHPQTARFISRKIAIRFVNDDPDEELVDEMAKIFLESKGDIKAVLTAMVYSSEFWKRDNMGAKVKTPFELAISSVRALRGTVANPNRLIQWVTRMGERKYYHIAPTGFADRSSYWISTGSLLNRMNFGLSFATTRTSGVEVDLLGVMGYREPEGPEQALEAYSGILVPLADIEKLKSRLSPLLTQDLQSKGSSADNSMLTQIVGLIIGSPEFQRR